MTIRSKARRRVVLIAALIAAISGVAIGFDALFGAGVLGRSGDALRIFVGGNAAAYEQQVSDIDITVEPGDNEEIRVTYFADIYGSFARGELSSTGTRYPGFPPMAFVPKGARVAKPNRSFVGNLEAMSATPFRYEQLFVYEGATPTSSDQMVPMNPMIIRSGGGRDGWLATLSFEIDAPTYRRTSLAERTIRVDWDNSSGRLLDNKSKDARVRVLLCSCFSRSVSQDLVEISSDQDMVSFGYGGSRTVDATITNDAVAVIQPALLWLLISCLGLLSAEFFYWARENSEPSVKDR